MRSDKAHEHLIADAMDMLEKLGWAMLPDNSEITHRHIARCIAEYFYLRWNPMYTTMAFRLEGKPTDGKSLWNIH